MQPPIRRHDAWKHQVEAYHFAQAHRPATMLAMEMGTGKSKVTIDLNVNGGWATTLILCPKSVLGVWRREHERHWPTDHQEIALEVLDKGTSKHKAEQLRNFLRYNMSTNKVVVVNYDSAWRQPLGDCLLGTDFDAVVCDESHRIKSPGGKASRWCQRLGVAAPRRLCLTGTPMPHSPLDLYAQFRFLDPTIFGTSFTRFRSRYAINNPLFPSQIRQWINQEELQERFLSVTYQCKAADVLDLPPLVYDVRSCQLEPGTARVYHDLEKEFLAEVDAGTVTVANALTKSLRLRQVTSGYVGGRDEHDTEFIQELGTEKRELLADLLQDMDAPCVVFCVFRHSLDIVEAVAASLKRRYGELSGRRRDALTDHSEMNPDIDIAGVQIQSGGVGIDLTRARYAIYFEPSWSLGDTDQSIARLHRPGQQHAVTIYRLVAEKTIDELVYQALEKRQAVIDYILINKREQAA